MPLSAYDRWKTTPPPYRVQAGDCLECGPTEWVAARVLIARELRGVPKSLRREKWRRLLSRIDADERYCAACRGDAARHRISPCECGAGTAWGCRCP